MSATSFNLSLLSSSTASSASFSVSPDVTALSVIVVLMAVTAIGSILSLLYLNSRPWAISKRSVAAPLPLPAYKQQALKEGLQLLELPKDRKLAAAVRTTQGIQPLPDGTTAAVTASALPTGVEADEPQPAASAPRLSLTAPTRPPAVSDALQPLLVGASSTINPELEDGTNDIYLHEMSTAQHSSLDGFDLSTATSILADTRQAFTSFFASQSAAFSSFTEAVQLQLEHLKQLLSVKLSVTLSRQNLSFAEAIDRIVAAELLARQAAKDQHRRMESQLSTDLEQLVTTIRNVSDDYDCFPIKQLVRTVCSEVERLELLWRSERTRRKQFASYTQLVGRRIVEVLAGLDAAEEPLIDSYLSGLLFFQSSAVELMKRLQLEEQHHAGCMEKIDDSNAVRREYELDRFHLAAMKTLRDLQTQLSYLDEKLQPLFAGIRRAEDNATLSWAYVQGPLLEERWEQLETEAQRQGGGQHGLWRGVNSDLAKLLSAMLGAKLGLHWDEQGRWKEKGGFDPTDPFCTIFDPGFAEEKKETEEREKDSSSSSKGKKKRKGEKTADTAADEPRSPSAASAVPFSSLSLTPLPAPPSSLLSPFNSTCDIALAQLLHRRQAVQTDASLSPAALQAELSRVDGDVQLLMEEWTGDAVETLCGWRAVQEMETRRGEEEKAMQTAVEEQTVKREQDAAALQSELNELRQQHASQLSQLEAELKAEEERDKRRYGGDLSALTALLSRLQAMREEEEKTSTPQPRTAEEAEIEQIMEEEDTEDAAAIARLLLDRHADDRAERRDELKAQQGTETAAMAGRSAALEAAQQEAQELQRRLQEVHVKDEEMRRKEEEEGEGKPDVITVDYEAATGGGARQGRILAFDHSKLTTLDEEEEAARSSREEERELDMAALQSRVGDAAALSEADWQQRIAELQAEHAQQREQEQQAARARRQSLLQQLMSRCAQREEENQLAVQQLQEEQQDSETQLLASWQQRQVAMKGQANLKRAVAALLARRQQRELEELMQTMGRERAEMLRTELAARRSRGEDASAESVQPVVDQRLLAAERSRVQQLEDAHRQQLQAAFAQCGGDGQLGVQQWEMLRYGDMEQRREEIAQGMRAQQAGAAAERLRALSDDGLSAEEKAAAIRSLLDGVLHFDDRLDSERRRQEAEMQRRIDDKKKKRSEDEKQKQLNAKDDRMRAAIARQQQQQTEAAAAAPVTPTIPTPAASAAPPSPAPAAADADTQLRFNRIEELVRSLHADAASWRDAAYVDEEDAREPRYIGDTELRLCRTAELLPHQSFMLRFASALVSLLHASHPISSPSLSSSLPPTIVVVSSLPPALYPSCAYKHCTRYDPALHCVYLRQERLDQPGRCLHAVLHAVAHVNAEWEARREVRRRAWKEQRKREATMQEAKEEKEELKVDADDSLEVEVRLRWEEAEAQQVRRTWDDRDNRFQRHLQLLQTAVMADFFFSASASPERRRAMLGLQSLARDEKQREEEKEEQSTTTTTLSSAALDTALSSLLSQHPPASAAAAAAGSVSGRPLAYSHLPGFSASRLLSRLQAYCAFDQQWELQQYLHALEQRLQQRETDAMPRSACLQTQCEQRQQAVDDSELDEAEDELNAALLLTAKQLYELRADVEKAETDSESAREGKPAEAEDGKAAAAMRDKRWRLSLLLHEKDGIIARLRNVQAARDERAAAAAAAANMSEA